MGEGQLGDGHGVHARAVRDVDASGGRGGGVDGVCAGAGAHDELQAAPGLDVRGVHLRAAHDERVGLVLGEGGGEGGSGWRGSVGFQCA